MGKARLNIVLHKIVEGRQELKSRYDVTEDFAYELAEQFQRVTRNFSVELGVFLDDGYRSQYSCALRTARDFGIKTFIPLISEAIGTEGYLVQEEIDALKQESKVSFCSHGVSHAALGVYENERVVSTPKGGVYRNMPRGHASVLTEEEIRYQLKESWKQLSERGIEAETFVYPYGIYSEDILHIVEREGLYEKAYTCDVGLEWTGVRPLAIPRLLVDNTLSVAEWTKTAEKLLNSSFLNKSEV
jgi:peptidoglycan/xylan/chitin deacetylase (PgdA/CDA1 family)